MSESEVPEVVQHLANDLGGTVEEVGGPLPDGSGFAVMSMPLPKDHWLTKDGWDEPPAPFRMGTANPIRMVCTEPVKEAARYAIRVTTDNGKIDDYDPDALIQNLIVGLFGYHTSDGLSHI